MAKGNTTGSKYSLIALDAVKEARNGANPREAWEAAAQKWLHGRTISQIKSCPRSTFLGLIDAGMVVGVVPGNFTTSVLNKNYAIRAVKLLAKHPELSQSPTEMWRKVLGSESKQHNGQMNIVAALWDNNLIKINQPPSLTR